MSERKCTDCVFVEPTKTGSLDKCGYPVPYWIVVGPSPYITPIYAENCATFKSRQDLIKQAKVESK